MASACGSGATASREEHDARSAAAISGAQRPKASVFTPDLSMRIVWFARAAAERGRSLACRARGRAVSADALRNTADPRAVDALASVVSTEERARVRGAIARLSSADQRILQLTFFEGLSPAEAADRLGEPALRVRKRKSRALE